jgi:hypothetical protein
MTIFAGNWLRRTSSRNFDAPYALVYLVVACIGAGVLVALVDWLVHIPWRPPGWRGFLVITILVGTRIATKQKWVATLTAIAAVVASLAFRDPEITTITGYIFAGLCIDALLLLAPRWRSNVAYIAAVGGIANMAKFVATPLAIAAGHAVSGSGGWAGPLLGHFLFGATGALIASLILLRPRG